jgi:hypothetical protein
MSLFTAKRADGKAEWRVVYERLKDAPYGETVPFSELCQLLETPEVGSSIYAAVRRANEELRKNAMRSAEVVRGLGYRIIQPDEHVLQARRVRCKALRQQKTAVDIRRGTNLAMLEAEARRMAIEELNGDAALLAVMINHERRIVKAEQMIELAYTETTARLNHHETEIERMKRVLEEVKGAKG